MFGNFIGKGTVILTKKEFDETPVLVGHELANLDMYQTLFQFRFMDMTGRWVLVDVVYVDGDDEPEKGVNILCTKIEIEE